MSAILEVNKLEATGLSYFPLHPTIGAEVEGVDLSKPISDAVRDHMNGVHQKSPGLCFPPGGHYGSEEQASANVIREL